MTFLPFVCLGIGILLGLCIKSGAFLHMSETVSTFALILLMMCIGIGIGVDENIVREFPQIGLNCIIISVSVIVFSVIFTVMCEKTVLPLKKFEQKFNTADNVDSSKDGGEISSLVWVMPASIIVGLIIGIIFRNNIPVSFTDLAFMISLIVLYICVGISTGSNKEVFQYLKMLGARVLWLPVAILLGSFVGGYIPSLFLDLPNEIPVVAACGMSFYSITGAYMTQTYGLALGTYGFIVNVLRELITILAMPLLIKISPGSPIAGGAAGDMDTMLAPVTRFVGPQLSLVTLLTGTILTIIVPVILPIMTQIFD